MKTRIDLGKINVAAIATMPEGVKERWRTAGRFADVLEAEVKTRHLATFTREPCEVPPGFGLRWLAGNTLSLLAREN
jgi:hypothetical protein